MTRVTLTINLDLEMASLPSPDALSTAMQRAEQAAARVFVSGDRGGVMHVTIEKSDNPIEITCGAVNVRPGYMKASILRNPQRKTQAGQ